MYINDSPVRWMHRAKTPTYSPGSGSGRASAAVDHLIGLLNSYPPIDEEYALSDSKFAAILMNKAAKVVCPHRSYATGI
jgi:hypothetical protein